MQPFKDRVALVTGSTGEGLGRSIAFTLAREGAKVVINYGTGHPNNANAAEKVLAEIRTLGGKGYAFKADTREEDEVQSMIEGILTLYGRLDFLICNAGGAWEARDITEIEQEQWRSVIKAEVDGVFYCIKHALPHMREAHFGRIIAVGFGELSSSSGPPYDYMIGKVGRHALIESIAKTEIASGITCNIVAPSHTQRPTMKQAIDAAKHVPSWKRRTSATTQDGAEVVRFLCSDEAAFVTGSVIQISDGN
jgi:NAD(P)-dependent dehydrogenase (short-subunit alcohol dehydrogenase family)